ncbi:MAG: type III pantothenate kinase [Owenweeksia sp.]
MNLIIDIGNSQTKAALFEKGKLKAKQVFSAFEDNAISSWWKSEGEPKQGILSNVGRKVNWPAVWTFPVLELDHQTKLPFVNAYSTPETLGKDRMALTAAAVMFYPGHDCLIIDAGTCVTYDFVDRNKTYHGGGISPGLHMRLKSLQHFTSRLPLVNYSIGFELIGTTTATSILSGTVGGLKREVENTIAAYQSRYPSMITIITGGDANLFDDLLKNSIFAPPDFLITGLNHILDYNAERL